MLLLAISLSVNSAMSQNAGAGSSKRKSNRYSRPLDDLDRRIRAMELELGIESDTEE